MLFLSFEIFFVSFVMTHALDIQNKIWSNAGLEFEAIWNEHVKTGLPRAILSDAISKRINDLNDSVSAYVNNCNIDD